jgi:hypothetical protein
MEAVDGARRGGMMSPAVPRSLVHRLATKNPKEVHLMKPLASVLVIAFTFLQLAPAQEGPRNKMEGTWEVVSEGLPKSLRQVKLITATHFTWVVYDREKKLPQASAGGRYSLKGDAYKEQIEFAFEGLQDLVGKEQPFTVRFEGDRFFLSGTLTNGTRLEEVWVRVK